MALDLSPRLAQKVFEGEGGSYHSWSSSEFPILKEAEVGAGLLVLEPRGFAFPHFADSSKVGYVIQGEDGLVGMVSPKSSSEVVLKIKKGDAIPIPVGEVSWWFNAGDSKLEVVFLGETSTAYTAGEITYFLLTGAAGVLAGFSPEFISRTYSIGGAEAEKLVKSQDGVLIIKLEKEIRMPDPNSMEIAEKMVYNVGAASPDLSVKKAGSIRNLTAARFNYLGRTGLSISLEKLEANAARSPAYLAGGSGVQISYVTKGSGKVQIVGLNGERVLDAEVNAGHLFVVPRFFLTAKMASGEGMECLSVINTPNPVVEELAGKVSVWEALSPAVLQASLKVNSEFEKYFKSKSRSSTILIPPSN